ncbi:MAG: lipoyl(octanoyl) transferase LipB [Thermoanaerobaculia bacterium]
MPRELRWAFLGRVPYAPLADLQERLRRGIRFDGGAEHLLLLEHDPVYTVGRNASEDDVLAPRRSLEARGIGLHRTNRGGQVTYHGPGQLVGYPILNLDPDRRDVRRYVRDLQEVLIRTLGDFGLAARRRQGQDLIGVWIGDQKIASIGVHLSHWITIHGFALNVSTDLDDFAGIVACGLPRVRMTSIAKATGTAPALAEVGSRVVHHLSSIFERRPVAAAPESLLALLESEPTSAVSQHE